MPNQRAGMLQKSPVTYKVSIVTGTLFKAGASLPAWPMPASRPVPGLTFSLPPATIYRMYKCSGAQGYARTAVHPCRQKKARTNVAALEKPPWGEVEER